MAAEKSGGTVRRTAGPVGRVTRRLRGRAVVAEQVDELAARVAELEAEVQECRQLNLRLAELTDIVQELLVPIAQRDEQRVDELLERYAKGL